MKRSYSAGFALWQNSKCLYLSSTPKTREVIKRRLAKPLHGSLTPTVVLTEPPSLPAAGHVRSGCDWTGVSLTPSPFVAVPGANNPCGLIRFQGYPVFIAGRFSLRVWDKTVGHRKCDSPFLIFHKHHCATANVATAHGGSNGNVLDEWVLSFQGVPIHRRKTGNRRGAEKPSHPFPHSEPIFQP